MIYTNPRTRAVIEDWPYGKLRTTCTFYMEKLKQGERIVRVTVNPKTGLPNKPHVLTAGRKARIVDGDDGKIYLAMLTWYDHISIMQSNMQYSQEAIFEHDDRHDDRFATVKEFFKWDFGAGALVELANLIGGREP